MFVKLRKIEEVALASGFPSFVLFCQLIWALDAEIMLNTLLEFLALYNNWSVQDALIIFVTLFVPLLIPSFPWN